jgi:hypothetical protein
MIFECSKSDLLEVLKKYKHKKRCHYLKICILLYSEKSLYGKESGNC